MKTYLVGGAVRDALLGRVSKDRDWVVVGETPETMLAAGFTQVGADFPVFLHPVTGEEYALARTERKVGQGYQGFVTTYDPNVTLVDDLVRRDLTINAMAMDDEGNLTDPHGGAVDLRQGILRAVSDAFAEDPLRVLRVGRFAARYGFSVEAKTESMCAELAARTEFAELSPDRLGTEMLKALSEPRPDEFFRFLRRIDALHVHFPELAALVGQTQPVEHHPEGDAFEHTMLVLEQAAVADLDEKGRFGALVHDLGKSLTPRERLPSHHGHELAGVPLVEAMCERLRLSTELRKAGQMAAEYHAHVHRIFEMTPRSIAGLASAIGVSHHAANAGFLASVSACDARGRLGRTDDPYPAGEAFVDVMTAVAAVKFRDRFSPEEIAGMSIPARQAAQARIRTIAVKDWMRERREAVSTPSL